MHLLGQPIAASFRLVHRLHQFLYGDLSRGMLKSLRRKPEPMLARPMLAAGIKRVRVAKGSPTPADARAAMPPPPLAGRGKDRAWLRRLD